MVAVALSVLPLLFVEVGERAPAIAVPMLLALAEALLSLPVTLAVLDAPAIASELTVLFELPVPYNALCALPPELPDEVTVFV